MLGINIRCRIGIRSVQLYLEIYVNLVSLYDPVKQLWSQINIAVTVFKIQKLDTILEPDFDQGVLCRGKHQLY